MTPSSWSFKTASEDPCQKFQRMSSFPPEIARDPEGVE
jgi:hypothetical protein